MEGKKNISIPIKSIKKGNIEVLLEWVELNKEKLYKISWAYLKSHADVEDVFHDTIIKIIENVNKLKNEEAFEAWFISILLNECRKTLRNKKRMQLSDDIEINNNISYSEEQAEKIDLINELKKLDEEYKEIIILKYYSGYSQKEIAEILSIPLGTVKTKIFRGIKILRQVLGREA